MGKVALEVEIMRFAGLRRNRGRVPLLERMTIKSVIPSMRIKLMTLQRDKQNIKL